MSPINISKKFITIFNKYYYIFLIVIVLVVLGAGYYFFIQEKVAEIQQVGTVDLDGKLNTKNIIQKNLDKLEELNEKKSQISQTSLDKLSKVLPKKSEIPFLMIELENFIEDNGLVLNSLDIGPLTGDDADNPVASNTVNELKITLSFSGIESYLQLKNFLQIMSEQLPLIELSSLNYNDTISGYSLNLTTYYQ